MRRGESVSCMVNEYNRVLVEDVQEERQIGKPMQKCAVVHITIRR
jgi:hypothetical protein